MAKAFVNDSQRGNYSLSSSSVSPATECVLVRILSHVFCPRYLSLQLNHTMKIYDKEFEIRLVCPVAAEFASSLCCDSHCVRYKNGSLLSVQMQMLMKDHMQYHVVNETLMT